MINILDRHVAELIAAGEVVERPASVVKELVENSIDAGATSVTVEIERGGVALIRITDNGSGIVREDVKKAFLRHATSKIKSGDDLSNIGTLGFRGEALASICAVSRTEILTKCKNEEFGTDYTISGGDEGEMLDAGCPDGTTFFIRDLFYNTPARMKFLKKDVTEANAVAAIVERETLAHPEIAFTFIRDKRRMFNTPGDGNPMSAIYSVLGRDMATNLIEVNNNAGGVSVKGYISVPTSCKPNRNTQFTVLNGRFVIAKTVMAALDQAYKNTIMVGKFPAAVLYITLPLEAVDVNVHPAKTEVRFSEEKRVFDCVYYGVRDALMTKDKRPSMNIGLKPLKNVVEKSEQMPLKSAPVTKPSEAFKTIKASEFKELERKPKEKVSYEKILKNFINSKTDLNLNVSESAEKTEDENEFVIQSSAVDIKKIQEAEIPVTVSEVEKKAIISESPIKNKMIRYIGEAFSTYVVAEMGDSIYLIDKHAAHERIIFEKLKADLKVEVQYLVAPRTVHLQKNEYSAVLSGIDEISKCGFEVEDFDGDIIVRAVPVILKDENIDNLMSEIANNLLENKKTEVGRVDDILHTVACRAAVKAGNKSAEDDLKYLVEKILSSNDIMYCPHGRPVAMEIKKHTIEKEFGRLG